MGGEVWREKIFERAQNGEGSMTTGRRRLCQRGGNSKIIKQGASPLCLEFPVSHCHLLPFSKWSNLKALSYCFFLIVPFFDILLLSLANGHLEAAAALATLKLDVAVLLLQAWRSPLTRCDWFLFSDFTYSDLTVGSEIRVGRRNWVSLPI